jgi:hypothetical protein
MATSMLLVSRERWERLQEKVKLQEKLLADQTPVMPSNYIKVDNKDNTCMKKESAIQKQTIDYITDTTIGKGRKPGGIKRGIVKNNGLTVPPPGIPYNRKPLSKETRLRDLEAEKPLISMIQGWENY